MNGGEPSALLELDVRRMAGPHRMRDRLQSVGQQVASGQHRKHAGARIAAATSIDRIRACACGERTITA